MADRPEYKSIWTGQQVDDAVGKVIGDGATILTTKDIVQTEGTSPTKVMSQAAVTSALQNLPTETQIDEAISEHNEDTSAHPYIQGLVNAKPNALNDRSTSQTDTYSANYINNSFAPITFVSNLYAQRVNDNTADLVDDAPALSSQNVLLSSNTTNTDYDWTSPDFTFTRDLEVATTLTAQNSFAVNLEFIVNRNANISWGARIKVSQDTGANWEYISDKQAYGAVFYGVSVGNTATFNVFTNSIQGAVTFPIGTLLAIELYKKQSSATPLTTSIYCGVEVDNAGIYTYAQFNFANVNIGTNQLEDGSVTKQKLEQSVRNTLDDVATIKGNYAKVNEENTFTKTQTFTAITSNTPQNGIIINTKSGSGYSGAAIDFYYDSSASNCRIVRTSSGITILGVEEIQGTGSNQELILGRDVRPFVDKWGNLGRQDGRWNNLYLANNLSDGTNSATIAQIVEALTIERLGE